jgi:hypothetical protein
LSRVKAYRYHAKNYPADLPRLGKTTIFLCAVGGIFFSKSLSKDAQLLARLPRPNHHKEEKMADVNVPQRLDPQEIVKLLVALRRALKARAA